MRYVRVACSLCVSLCVSCWLCRWVGCTHRITQFLEQRAEATRMMKTTPQTPSRELAGEREKASVQVAGTESMVNFNLIVCGPGTADTDASHQSCR